GRACRRAVGAAGWGATCDGHRRAHHRLRGGGHRGARLVLGTSRFGTAGRHRGHTDRRLRADVLPGLHVRADDRGAAVPPAWPVRPVLGAVRMSAMLPRFLRHPMTLFGAALLVLPFAVVFTTGSVLVATEIA